MISAKSLGLVPYDLKKDNGYLLSEQIRKGNIDQTIELTGGWYHAVTPVMDYGMEGLSLVGQGKCLWRRSGAFDSDSLGCSPAIWLYKGPNNTGAFELVGAGHYVKGVNIFRHWYVDGDSPWSKFDPNTGTRMDTAVAIKGGFNGSVASGKHLFEQFTIAGFDRTIHLPKSNHQDNMLFKEINTQQNRVTLHCENDQSSRIDFEGLWVAGRGEIIFDWEEGGNSACRSLKLNERRLIHRFGDPGPGANTGSYRISNFKADNNSKGWRLLEVMCPQTLKVVVEGHVGKICPPHNDWMNFYGDWSKSMKGLYIDIDLWPGNNVPAIELEGRVLWQPPV